MKVTDGALHLLFKGESLYPTTESADAKSEVATSSSADASASSREDYVMVINGASPQDKEFLGKVLAAVKVDINKCLLTDKDGFVEATSQYTPKACLVFGYNAYELGIKDKQIDLYQPSSYSSCAIMVCDKLAAIATDQAKKQALWLNLKKMFNV